MAVPRIGILGGGSLVESVAMKWPKGKGVRGGSSPPTHMGAQHFFLLLSLNSSVQSQQLALANIKVTLTYNT